MQAASTQKLCLGCVAMCLAVLLSLYSHPSYAQVLYGTLTGNVTDASGAAVPDAKVEALNVATGVVGNVSTDDRGVYLFNDLQTGTYKVTLSAPFLPNSGAAMSQHQSKHRFASGHGS